MICWHTHTFMHAHKTLCWNARTDAQIHTRTHIFTHRKSRDLHVSTDNSTMMECDTREGSVSPMECNSAERGTDREAGGVFSSGGNGSDRKRGSGGLKGPVMRGIRTSGGKHAATPDTPSTPRPLSSPFPPPTSFLSLAGDSWEGEVADVSALMAGLGAHAACEEAAAAAVAADVHRRLAELAKGCVSIACLWVSFCV